MADKRVLTGMRTTGALHLGHYVGALKQWKEVQDSNQYECFFLLADVQALTTHAHKPELLSQSVKDVVLDWWPIPKKNDKRGATVLLAAVQRDIVEKYKRIVTVAQLESAGFEIEAFPPTRLLGSRGRGAVMTIDIGALSTKISIVVDGIIHAVHHVDRASQAFSLAISQSLGIDFQRAEVMKQSVGISQRPEAAGVRHTITPLIDSLFDEADRLRTSFRRRFDTPVDKAIVLGGGSLMPGFVDYAVERLGIEVILSNPFQKLSYPAFLQPALKKIAPSFTVATGLALRALGEEL